MEKKLKITISVMFAALFGAFIAMLKIVDVRPVGPAGTSVGLATLNGSAHELIGKLTTSHGKFKHKLTMGGYKIAQKWFGFN